MLFVFFAAPEMLDPKARVRTDDGGAPFEWMSVPSVPAVKEVAIQPATTDVFLQSIAATRPDTATEKHSDTILTTRSVIIVVVVLVEAVAALALCISGNIVWHISKVVQH